MVGTPRRRLEGGAKVLGEPIFAGDLKPPGLVHARLVLCPHHAARIESVDTAAAAAMPGVLAAVSARDLGDAWVPGLMLLARDRAVFAGQPVAVVVAETEAQAADAAAAVAVDYEPLPAVLTAAASLAEGAPEVIAGRPNLTDHSILELGDTASLFRDCVAVEGGHFVLPAVHQAPLETHVVVATHGSAGFACWTPTQSLSITQHILAGALRAPLTSVKVIPTAVGGGFGGKLGILLEPLTCWLARRCNRPVRLALTRSEEFLFSGRATGCSIDLRLGAGPEGRLLALEATVLVDQGAGPGFPASRVGAFLVRPYTLGAYRVDCSGAMTNTPPANAFRGQPAAIACFALESALDDLSRALGLDPLELRLCNLRPEGAPDPTGGTWPRVGGRECLEAIRPLLGRLGPEAGIAYGVWDGYEGGAAAGCRLNADGTLTLEVGTPDISGTHTGLAMIAADAFGLPLEQVAVELGHSGTAPFSPAAGGSAVTYVVGGAVAEAAADARRQVLEVAAELLEAAVEDLNLEDGRVSVRGVPSRACTLAQVAAAVYGWHSHHAPIHGHARRVVASAAPMAAVQAARLKADPETGEWRVTSFAAVQDVGRALNPAEAEGQVHGGAMQGIGRAFGEELVRNADGFATDSFMTYSIPTADVAPDVQVTLVEVPSELGPLGARGAGEPPILPGPPAIANALFRSAGVRLRGLPFGFEDLWAEGRSPGALGSSNGEHAE